MGREEKEPREKKVKGEGGLIRGGAWPERPPDFNSS